MTKFKKIFSWKILVFLMLAVVISGVFYFEVSFIFRILVVLLGLLSLAFFSTMPEIIFLVILYFGLFDLYNIRYGLAVPLSVIMLLVFALSLFLFYSQLKIARREKNLDKNLTWLYLLTTGLIILEIFLTMSFWPVDPKIKSFVMIIVFYLISKIFYLYIDSVLNLKKVLVLALVSFFILGGILIFNWRFGF